MIAQALFTIADLSDAVAEVIVGTQTAATNAWEGNASFSELRDGQTILGTSLDTAQLSPKLAGC